MLIRLVIALPNWGLRVLLCSCCIIIASRSGKENIPRCKAGAAGFKPHVLCGCSVDQRSHQPSHTFSDIPGCIRCPLYQAVRALMRAIPIPTEMRPRHCQLFREASDAIRAGELSGVC